jgi:hypothetical protein
MFQATVTISTSAGGELMHTADFRVESFGEVLRRKRCLAAQDGYFKKNYYFFNGAKYGNDFKERFSAAYPGNVHINLRKALCDHDPVLLPGLQPQLFFQNQTTLDWSAVPGLDTMTLLK